MVSRAWEVCARIVGGRRWVFGSYLRGGLEGGFGEGEGRGVPGAAGDEDEVA